MSLHGVPGEDKYSPSGLGDESPWRMLSTGEVKNIQTGDIVAAPAGSNYQTGDVVTFGGDSGMTGKDVAGIVGASAGLLAALAPTIVAATVKPKREREAPEPVQITMPQFQPLQMQRGYANQVPGAAFAMPSWLPWAGLAVGVPILGYLGYRLVTR